MNKKKILALSAALMLGAFAFAGEAHAATVDVFLNPDSSVSYSNVSIPVPLTSVPLTSTSQFSSMDFASLSGGILTVGGSPHLSGDATYQMPGFAGGHPSIFQFTWLDAPGGFSFVATDSNHSFYIPAPNVAGVVEFAQGPVTVEIIDLNASLKSFEFVNQYGDGITSGLQVGDFAVSTASGVSPTPLPGSLGLFLTALAALSFFAFRRGASFTR